MAQNFTVNYDINVLAQDAVTAINSFTQATKKLNQAMQPFRKLNTSISNMQNNLTKLNAKTYTVKLETSKAVNNVDKLIGRLRRLKAEARGAGINLGSITAGGAVAGGASTRSTGGKRVTAASAGRTAASSSVIARNMPKNLGYKLLGPTPLDTGGIMAVDMLKGMGIAYGIAGIGSLISNSVKDYTEYNNIMKTAENILGAHDKRADFKERFAAMEKQVRNVGVQTKFTAPQVADASKFLAMAGFDVDAINKSIAPIADIALVGDTDLGETADVVTNIMTGYNISPEKVRKAADIMTMTFTKSNTTLMEIAEAYKYSASLLSAGDVPFEEATAAMGILGNAGIKGSQAGTTMRTIMANIVNPTKKQAAAWKRIGVSRTDKNGNMRDVVDIFEDLNKKDLSLSDYYQIFHKTAAQGAVSLANDVEGWNDIIKANFMSEGLAKQLADEKKNTIQGLWAQLTSMFTEDGIEAFDEIQQPIKDFLNNIISWLKTDEAKNFIKETAKDLLDFAKMIAEVTRTMLIFFDAFRTPIKWFLKFQMYMMPLLSVARIGKAMTLGALGVLKFASSISVLASNLKFLNVGKFGLMGAVAAINGNPGLGTLTPAGDGMLYSSTKGRYVSVDAAQRYNNMYTRGASITGTMASLAGGALGGYVGYQLGEDLSDNSPVGGLIGSVLGSVGGMALAQYLPSLGALAIANPITAIVGGVTAAVGGLGYAIYQYNKSIDDGIVAAQKWIDNFNELSLRGIDVMKQFGLIQAYQTIEASDATPEEKAEMRKRMFNKWYNGTKTSVEEPDPTTAYANIPIGKELKDNLNIADQWAGKFEYFMPQLEKLGLIKTPRVIAGEDYVDYWIGNNKIWDAQSKDKSRLNELQATQAAMILAGYAPDSPIAQQIDELAMQDIYGASRYSDIPSIWQRIRKSVWPQQQLMYNDKSSEDVAQMNTQQLFNGYYTQVGLELRFQEIQKKFEDWESLAYRYDNGLEITAEQVQRVLFNRLGDLFDPQNGLFGTQEFTNYLKNVIQNPDKYGYSDQKTAIAAVQKTFTDLLDFFNLLDTHYKPLFADYLNRNIFEGILPKGFNLPEGGIVGGTKAGDTTIIDGTKYTWKPNNLIEKNPTYGWYDAKGNKYTPKNAKDTANGGTGTGRNGRAGNGSITPATHNTKGASQADYKQHYNNNTAAPKQVIVKIENLMNVKSIDLSKKDNKEVIDNVKSQLTQALVDVVHDFDETWHG